MFPKKILNTFVSNPNKLFLVDAFGALLSAFLVGIVLVRFERFFGIPSSTLYFLAALPILFAVYDFVCFIKITANHSSFLMGIAIVNLGYCCVSIGMALFHLDSVTNWGWAYIFTEVFIVALIAIFELSVAKRSRSKSR